MHVRVLFEHLRAADLKLTKRKCSFLKAHVQYLGHYISSQGLEPVPEEVRSVGEDASTQGCDRSQEIPRVRGVLPQVYPKILGCG